MTRIVSPDLIGTALTGYGAVWAAVNTYNFYPLARKAAQDRFGRTEQQRPAPDYEEVPDIDVLIPAYREAEVIELPLRSIMESDYPGDRVTPHVLVEPDDAGTRDALAALEEDYEFEEVVVPADYPGTGNKPRALNYGFEQSDGDIVGVLDAEDIPADDLFDQVVAEIEGLDRDYVQGVLDMANEEDGWMNTMFRGEYSFWFRDLLPAYHEAGYPVPLGGTTNFFRREVLKEISEKRKDRYGEQFDLDQRFDMFTNGLDATAPWNPDNVTEDFELGMFLWEEDYEMGRLDAITREESPREFRNWMRQRTRWQKGKIQTLEQYLEEPPETLREKTHIYLQSALPHLGPLNASGVAVSATAYASSTPLPPVTELLLGTGMASVATYMGLQARAYARATDEEKRTTRWTRTITNAVSLPLYWTQQWAADGRALKQEYLDDVGWEKTPHHGAHDER